VEGVPKFHVSPGAYKGRKAVQIQGTCTESQSIVDESPG